MHIIIALVGIILGAIIWFNRAQRAADVAGDLIGAAADVKNAARRFGFRRRANQHPVQGIDDPQLAIGGLASAFLEMDDLPTTEARQTMDIALRKHLQVDAETAQELAIMGHWFVEECNGPVPAFPRLAKKLKELDGGASFQPLMAVLKDVAEAGGGSPSQRQSEALSDLGRVFRLS